jgi:hypothetical protein
VTTSSQALLEDTNFTHFDMTGSALDQILVHLRTDVSALEDTTSPKPFTEAEV